MMFKKLSLTVLIIFVSISLFALIGAFEVADTAEADSIVRTKEDLLRALAMKTESIEVGDIDLYGTSITLNYDVKIFSKSKATLKNAYVDLVAPNHQNRAINVVLQNLIFEGEYADSVIDDDKPFEENFPSCRGCIQADVGYYSLLLDNCSVTSYAAEVGACIYVENSYRQGRKNLELKGCKFYGNYAEKDVLHVSNDDMLVVMRECEFYGNHANKGAGFSIANVEVDVKDVSVHDNFFHSFDVSENPQTCGGGVYLGGVSGIVDSLSIRNNEAVYGGGLGISPRVSGVAELTLSNISIVGNKAKFGGAVCAHSISGQPIRFLNSEFLGNTAEYGSSLYAITYAFFNKNNNGGIVEFLFSTFARNSATDKDTFDFYLKEATKGELGFVSLKGCFVIGDDEYSTEFSDYNYVANENKALLDKVIDEDALAACLNDGIYPIKGSIADIDIPVSVYSTWSPAFASPAVNAKIGKPAAKTEEVKKSLDYGWTIAIVCVAVIMTVAAFALKRKSKETPVEPDDEIDNSKELLSRNWTYLNEREQKVALLTIMCKKRSDIASELQFSENTIKKDLTSIYSKLNVGGKAELIAKYQEFVKSI